MSTLIADELLDVRRSVREVAQRLVGSGSELRHPDSVQLLDGVVEIAELGLLDVGRDVADDGLGLEGAIVVLAELARWWPALAWGCLPRVLLVACSDVEPQGTIGLASSELGGSIGSVTVSGAEGSRRVTGSLATVVNGATADHVLVLGADDAAYLVDTTASTRGEDVGFEGFRGVIHSGLEVSDAAVVLDIDGASAIAVERVLTGAIAAGIARASVASARDYMRQRVQFGRPIVEYGELRAMLASSSARATASRAALLDAAARGPRDPAFCAVAAGAFSMAAEAAVEASEFAQHAHGGYGHMTEFPVHSLVRDARMVAACVSSRADVDEAILTALDIEP